MTPSNRELIQAWEKIVRGDTHAFADFVDQHKNLVASIAYSVTGELSSSEDIAQEAFLVAWQSREELSDTSKLVSWLSSIARNLAKQWVRQRSAKSWASDNLDEITISQDQPHPADRLISLEEQQLIWSVLEALPESYREVLILYYRENHSIANVASALEITEEAARQRLSRGRQLLRTEVERTVEIALAKSRPSARFTANVVSLLAISSNSTVGKFTAGAAASVIGKTTAQGTLLASTQTAATGAMLGAAGGLLGTLVGLAGAWVGIRLPQLMAPTMTERRLLEREGKIIWRILWIFLCVSFLSIGIALPFAGQRNVILFVVLGNVGLSLCFPLIFFIRGIKMNQQIKVIRQTVSPEQDPNPNWFKDRMGIAKPHGMARLRGRKVTSKSTLLGWPIYDFQVSDSDAAHSRAPALHAKGWIAVGDKATGFIALGGYARGVFAFGGFTIGLVSFGGIAMGLLSMGGLAVGMLTAGGLAVGHSAIGGCAVGWQAAGGGAFGVYSANGGLAIAGNIAEGGLAISRKYAVGGQAVAPEANTRSRLSIAAPLGSRNTW